MTTRHQFNTLLAHLKNQTVSDEGMLFFNPLIHAKLDYSSESIERLSRLLTQLQRYLTQKNTPLETLIEQPQSRLFFLTVAGYLGDYLAKCCDEPIVWYSYFEARTEIDKKNREYGTNFQLEPTFENSVVAKIGDNIYCQPLKPIQTHLTGQGEVSKFVTHMVQEIFEQAHVNIMAEPNQVCRDYLKKVQTGRLLDTTLGFFEPLKTINFDYSLASLAQLDTVLANIKQQYHLNPDNYQTIIAEPAYQATFYLLGFYIGMTCASLTKKPVTWANYQQIYRTLIYANPNAKLIDSIEHSFVMVVDTQTNNTTEKRFVTPILAVTQALFSMAEKFGRAETQNIPATSMAFYHAFEQYCIKDKPLPALQYFPYSPFTPTRINATELPKFWYIAVQSASRLVNNNLMQIFDGGELEPQLFDIDPISNKGSIQPTATLGKMTLATYFKDNPEKSPVLVATHDTLINLPTGQCDGIAIDIAVYQEPKLQLRLIVPYRSSDNPIGFAIYPLIVAKVVMHEAMHKARQSEQQGNIIKALVAEFYQTATDFISPLHEGSFWQNYYIEPVNSLKKSPLQIQIDEKQVEKIDLTLLPVAPLEPIRPVMATSAEPALSSYRVEPQLIEPQALQKVAVQNPIPILTTQPLNQPISASLTPLITLEQATETGSLKTETVMTPLAKKAQISPELLAKLRQDQQRLQSELSSSDSDKNRKIVTIIGTVLGLLVLLLLGVWVMK